MLCPVGYCFKVPLKGEHIQFVLGKGLSTSPHIPPDTWALLCIGVSSFSEPSLAETALRKRRDDHGMIERFTHLRFNRLRSITFAGLALITFMVASRARCFRLHQ